MKPDSIVIQTEHLSPDAAQWLGARCRLVQCAHDSPEFDQFIRSAVGLVIRTYTIVNDSLLARAPNLRVIGRAGVGLDNVDLAACRRRNIAIVYTPDANTQAVVEYVIGLMCDALRPRPTISQSLDSTSWNQMREREVGTRQWNQLTLGILGFGRIGKRLAQVAHAIGCRVIFNDLQDISPAHRSTADPVDVHTLFAQSDVLSIHIDGRPANRRFVNRDLLFRMKPNALLINTSRGMVVDDPSLAEWLRSHADAQAMLDVHEPEPFPPQYPLLGLPNVRLYPHLASRTAAAMDNMSWVVRDVVAVLEGREPEFAASLR